MKTEDHIKRYLSDPDGLDFDGIRSKGIALLQDLSRQQWTDYNLHDPGVTLLELLSYGLTDLVYRTDFEVADFLAGPSGHIDFHGQALYPPQEIFPNAPVTDIDYCKLIYDHRPMVDDVWIQSAGPGLSEVFVKPHESLFSGNGDSECEGLKKDVETLLHVHRNLCRDVVGVRIVRGQRYRLGGEIEIDDSRPSAEIYADIYFRCAKLISSGGQLIRFEEALAAGMSWEQMLEGPLTEHGYIADDHFSQANYDVDVTTLITLVRHIPGVRWVRRLCLIDQHGEAHSEVRLPPAGDLCPVLAFPQEPAEVLSLRLRHGKSSSQPGAGAPDDDPRTPGRHASQLHEQIALYLRKLEFEYHAFRNNEGQLSRLVDLPQGSYRDLAEYSSIGEHTPAIYGINHYGVPGSDPPEVHARARQLKAYLYPFEQVMANYLASLQGVKRLYSTDETLDQTYFAQFLTDAEVPNLEVLYGDGVAGADVDAVLAEQDAFNDRRNRVLDSMLAVYGEVFPEDALRRFDVYHPDDFGLHLIACKIGLLRHLCDLSARRAQAVDVHASYWEGRNFAPVQLRVQLLAGGSEALPGRSLVAAVHNDALRFISDKRYQDRLHHQASYSDTVPLAWPEQPAMESGLEGLPHGAVSPSLMLAGIRKENYAVLPDGDHGWLCLNVDDERCWPLVRLPNDALAAGARHIRDSLIDVSKDSEGFHLLEHVLLRPRGEDAAHGGFDEFHAHRVSVVLPAFTARFSDRSCQAWMEELISQNLPAHILPTFYWLDFAFMAQFELRYRNWLAALNERADLAGIDAAAGKLIDFLGTVDPYHTNRHWM